MEPEHLPVEAMHYTVAQYYSEAEQGIPIGDERYFDGDLRHHLRLGRKPAARDVGQGAEPGEPAGAFLRTHRAELIRRMSYWTGEPPGLAQALIDFLIGRADVLELRTNGREAATLIELTAFGTAVLLNYRYTDALGGREPSP